MVVRVVGRIDCEVAAHAVHTRVDWWCFMFLVVVSVFTVYIPVLAVVAVISVVSNNGSFLI